MTLKIPVKHTKVNKNVKDRVLEGEIGEGIVVWDYDHLPEPVKTWMCEQKISTCDLDWIAILPPSYDNQYISWLTQPAFGCSDVQDYALSKDGYRLIVGYHA